MVTISVAVVHKDTPERNEDLALLLERVPTALVFTDEGEGMTATSRRAWHAGLYMNADWHVVMEDDVLPCDDFPSMAHAAIEWVPPEAIAVSMFGISSRLLRAWNADASWILDNGINWAQALAVEVSMLRGLLAWEAAYVRPEYPYWCQRVSLWAQALEAPIAVAIPSLVQHRGAGRSLIGNPPRAGGRHERLSPVFADDLPPRPWTFRAIEAHTHQPDGKEKWAA